MYTQTKKIVIGPFLQELEEGHRWTEESQESLPLMLGCHIIGESVFTWSIFTLWECWYSSN